MTSSLAGSLSGCCNSLSVSSCCLSGRQPLCLLLLSSSVSLSLPCPIRAPSLIELPNSDLLLAVLGVHHVVVDRHLLPKIPETPVGDLDSMSVEERIEDMAAGDGFIENPQEFGSDIAGDPGIPRRIEPPDLSFPSLLLPIVVVKLVNVLLFIFKIKGISAGFEGFLVLRLAFIEHLFIT